MPWIWRSKASRIRLSIRALWLIRRAGRNGLFLQRWIRQPVLGPFVLLGRDFFGTFADGVPAHRRYVARRARGAQVRQPGLLAHRMKLEANPDQCHENAELQSSVDVESHGRRFSASLRFGATRSAQRTDRRGSQPAPSEWQPERPGDLSDADLAVFPDAQFSQTFPRINRPKAVRARARDARSLRDEPSQAFAMPWSLARVHRAVRVADPAATPT